MRRQDGRAWLRSRKLNQARESAREQVASDAQNRQSAPRRDTAAAWSAPQHSGRIRLRMRRNWRRLGFRRQFVGLIVLAALLSTVATTSLGYLVLRANALAAAQARETRDLRVAWQVLRDQGATLALRQGELYAGTSAASAPLNGDGALVGDMRALTDDQASVYEVEGSQLVAIATTLDASNASATGTLGGPAHTALLGGCAAAESSADCARSYDGVVRLGGSDYLAALMPLRDASGATIGALGVFTPVDGVLAPVRLLMGVLLLVGLALTALILLLGMRLSGPIERRAFAAFTHGLDHMGNAAVRLETASGMQITRSERQGEVARQLIDEVRLLGEVAGGLEHSVAQLRQMAGDTWARASAQGSGTSGDALARQVALVATRAGNAAEHASQLCYRLRARANLVIAEADVLASCGRETREHAAALRAALVRVEDALGARASVSPPPAQQAPAATPTGAYDTQPTAAQPAASVHPVHPTGGSAAPRQATANPPAGQPQARQPRNAFKHPRLVSDARPDVASFRPGQYMPPPNASGHGVLSGPLGGGSVGAAQ